MNISKAEKIGRELMVKHGVSDWTFEWTTAERQFGWCSYVKHSIGISKPLTELNEEKHFVETMLHEIAHAIAPTNAHHGPVWKKIAKKIGCNPKWCYSDEVVRPIGRYTITCKHCDFTCQAIKRPRHGRKTACPICCKKFNHGHFAKKYILKYTKNKEGGEVK